MMESKVPAFDEMMQALVDALKQLGSESTVQELNDKVALLLGLTPNQLSVLHKPDSDDKTTRFEYNLGWTRTHLKMAGYIRSVKRGTWALTEKGKAADKLDIESVNLDVKTYLSNRKTTTETKLGVSNTEQGFTHNSIFLSYRRDDSVGTVGRIQDWLRPRFGKEAIYRDLDSIPFGVDFRKHLREAMQQCKVLIAVIGPHWLTIEDLQGQKRLDDPADFVRLEVEAALQRDIPVIPVLVDGAKMPKAYELSASLQDLAFRNGLSIRYDPDFEGDMNTLIDGLEKLLKK